MGKLPTSHSAGYKKKEDGGIFPSVLDQRCLYLTLIREWEAAVPTVWEWLTRSHLQWGTGLPEDSRGPAGLLLEQPAEQHRSKKPQMEHPYGFRKDWGAALSNMCQKNNIVLWSGPQGLWIRMDRCRKMGGQKSAALPPTALGQHKLQISK